MTTNTKSLAGRFAPAVLGTALLSGVFLIAPAAHADYYPGTNPYPYGGQYQNQNCYNTYQTGYPNYYCNVGYNYQYPTYSYNYYQPVSNGFINPGACTDRFDPNCILKEWGQYPGYQIPQYPTYQYGTQPYSYQYQYQYQYSYGNNPQYMYGYPAQPVYNYGY